MVGKRNIAIFGLSGNPPTGIHGHMGIVQFLVNLEEFDEIWILPVYIHQFSSKKLIDFYHRIKMCQLCMEKLGNRNTKVYVSSIEKEVNEVCGGNHGTIDTITYILNCNNDIKIDLIIGEDAYQDICNGKWKHGQRLFEICHIRVIGRLGLSNDCETTPPSQFLGYRWHKIPSLDSISSTVVRSCLAYPLWPLPLENPILIKELDSSVYDYMKFHQLYNFSAEDQRKLKRIRLCVLGMIGCACLFNVLR